MTTDAIACRPNMPQPPLKFPGPEPKPIESILHRIPSTNVVGEIKPHTQRGIADGLRQLRDRYLTLFRGLRLQKLPAGAKYQSLRPPPDRLPRPLGTTFLLITYRPSNAGIEALIADPDETTRATTTSGKRDPSSWKWFTLGTIKLDLNKLIPLSECPSKVGLCAEPPIRALYAQKMRIPLGEKHSSAPGADIAHELAGLIRNHQEADWQHYHGLIQLMRRELDLFGAPTQPADETARLRLRRLFASIPASKVLLLHHRLVYGRPDDDLFARFHGRLTPATRHQLLSILLAKAPMRSVSPTSPVIPR